MAVIEAGVATLDKLDDASGQAGVEPVLCGTTPIAVDQPLTTQAAVDIQEPTQMPGGDLQSPHRLQTTNAAALHPPQDLHPPQLFPTHGDSVPHRRTESLCSYGGQNRSAATAGLRPSCAPRAFEYDGRLTLFSLGAPQAPTFFFWRSRSNPVSARRPRRTPSRASCPARA